MVRVRRSLAATAAVALLVQFTAVGAFSLAATVSAAHVVETDACPHHRASTEPCTMKHCPMRDKDQPTRAPSHQPADTAECHFSCPSDQTVAIDLGLVALLAGADALATPVAADATIFASATMADQAQRVPSPPPRS